MLTIDISCVDEETFSISAGEKYGLSCQFVSTLVETSRGGSADSFWSLATDIGSSSSTVSFEEGEESSFLLTFINRETKYFFDQVLEDKEYYANASDPIVSSNSLEVQMRGTRPEIEFILQKMFLNLVQSTIRQKQKIILPFDFAGSINAELERLLPLSYTGQRCMHDTDKVNKELDEIASNSIFRSEEDPDLGQLLGKMCLSERDQLFSHSDGNGSSKRRKTQLGNFIAAE